MGHLPYESHWGEFSCNQKNPQIESYLLPVARLSFGTSEKTNIRGVASDRCWVLVQYLKNRGVTCFVLLQSVSGDGGGLSLFWK